MAATKKLARGAALVKKAIEASASTLSTPEPVPASILKKLRMPDDEKLPAGLKAFLAHDSSSLGWSFDDEEPEFEPMSLDELVEQEIGAEHMQAFGEAIEMLSGDCVLIEGDSEETSFLYVGSPDDAGEYPVVSLALDGGVAKVFGFWPFDVWVAQRHGVVARDAEEYVPAAQALADSNGDGRRAFESQHRDIEVGGKDDDEDEDEDEEEEDDK